MQLSRLVGGDLEISAVWVFLWIYASVVLFESEQWWVCAGEWAEVELEWWIKVQKKKEEWKKNKQWRRKEQKKKETEIITIPLKKIIIIIVKVKIIGILSKVIGTTAALHCWIQFSEGNAVQSMFTNSNLDNNLNVHLPHLRKLGFQNHPNLRGKQWLI